MITQFARLSVIGGVMTLTPLGASAALVAHWDFEEGGPATTTVDQVSSTASESLPTGISWAGTSGAPGQSNSLAFAGTSENKKTLELDTNLTGVDIGITGTGARTIAAWINIDTTATGRQGIFNYSPTNGGTGVDGGGDLRFVFLGASDLRLEVSKGAAKTTQMSLYDGQWHFVAAVIPAGANAQDVYFYIDGSIYNDENGSTMPINTASSAVAGSSDHVFIGNDHINSGEGAAFQGMIDNVQVYNTALNGEELDGLYNIPEPASFGLLGIGSMLLLRNRRRA